MIAIEQYIKNVETAIADLKQALAKQKIENQAKTDEQLNTELSVRF